MKTVNLNEIILNLHIHSVYSDGSQNHKEIADAALRAGLDALIITDHNVLVKGLQGYCGEKNRQVLLMVGEELHDQDRQPQKSHLLALGIDEELADCTAVPQKLIQKVKDAGGISFLAHPYDPALPAFGEDDISWEDWEINGFTGIELWNGFSELKIRIHNKFQAIFYAFFPQYVAQQPPEQTLEIWDRLLQKGQRVAVIGGSDAHASLHHMGPIHRIIFPYDFHFRCINSHLLLDRSLSGEATQDSQVILKALDKGHGFIGYDLPAPTRGFRFWAEVEEQNYIMGDEFEYDRPIDLKIHLPQKADCCLLRNGKPAALWKNSSDCKYSVQNLGVYRVEVYRPYLGRRRGWIFSNPIYIR